MSNLSVLAFDEIPRGQGGRGATEKIARLLDNSEIDAPSSLYDEALALANDCEYGLASSLFTRDYALIERARTELLFGETYINRFHFEAIQGFHAGWRKSGLGGADGKHGLREYLNTKVVYVQH